MGDPKKRVSFEMFKLRFDEVNAHKTPSQTLLTYTLMSDPIEILCGEHGRVWTKSSAAGLLARKSSCPECGMANSKKMLQPKLEGDGLPRAEFQARFDEKNKGQVTLLAYTQVSDPIRVLCALHGESVVSRADVAIRMKSSCHECAKALNPLIHARNETYEKALLKFAKQPAGHTIDLNDKTYSGNSPQYKMTCPIHGYRYESLNYLAKRGCSACCGSHMSADAITKFTPIP